MRRPTHSSVRKATSCWRSDAWTSSGRRVCTKAASSGARPPPTSTCWTAKAIRWPPIPWRRLAGSTTRRTCASCPRAGASWCAPAIPCSSPAPCPEGSSAMQPRASRARRIQASALASIASSLLVGGCCDSPQAASSSARVFENGPTVLYTTYGQYVDLEEDVYPAELHAGIDIGACPDGQSKVLALEEGYVVKSTFEDGQARPVDYTRHHVIVSRGEDRSRGILYGHLADTQFSLGAKVPRGAFLGSVVNWETSGFDHLHLQ